MSLQVREMPWETRGAAGGRADPSLDDKTVLRKSGERGATLPPRPLSFGHRAGPRTAVREVKGQALSVTPVVFPPG